MSLVGTLLFCTDCGNLLDREPSTTKKILCRICNTVNKNQWPSTVTTVSRPDAFPSSLQRKRAEIQTIADDQIETWAKTNKECPECNNPGLLFTDMQLRGADEGTTVFYRCSECNYRGKDDN